MPRNGPKVPKNNSKWQNIINWHWYGCVEETWTAMDKSYDPGLWVLNSLFSPNYPPTVVLDLMVWLWFGCCYKHWKMFYELNWSDMTQSSDPSRTIDPDCSTKLSSKFGLASAGASVPQGVFLSILVNTCQYFSILVNTCQYLSILVNTFQYLSILVNTCLCRCKCSAGGVLVLRNVLTSIFMFNPPGQKMQMFLKTLRHGGGSND